MGAGPKMPMKMKPGKNDLPPTWFFVPVFLFLGGGGCWFDGILPHRDVGLLFPNNIIDLVLWWAPCAPVAAGRGPCRFPRCKCVWCWRWNGLKYPPAGTGPFPRNNSPSKQVAQVVGKAPRRYPGGLAQLFHLPPDVNGPGACLFWWQTPALPFFFCTFR